MYCPLCCQDRCHYCDHCDHQYEESFSYIEQALPQWLKLETACNKFLENFSKKKKGKESLDADTQTFMEQSV